MGTILGTYGGDPLHQIVGRFPQEGEGTDPVRSELPPLQPVAGMAGMRECVNAFLDSVAAGGAPAVPLDEAVKLQELALAVEASRDSGAWEEVAYS